MGLEIGSLQRISLASDTEKSGRFGGRFELWRFYVQFASIGWKCSSRNSCQLGQRFWKLRRRSIGWTGVQGHWHPMPRRAQIQAAIQILLRPEDDRAEQVQLIFSRQYNDEWREKFDI